MQVRPMRVRSMLAVVATFCGIGGIVVVAGGPVPVGAATFTVTTTADVVNAADGVTSLREAFAAANASAGDDTIELGVGLTYVLTDCVAGPLVHDQVSVLTLDGNGSTLQQSCDATRLLTIGEPTPALELLDLRLLGGPNAASTAVEGLAVAASATGLVGLQNVEITGFIAPGVTASVVKAGMGHPTAPHQITIVDSEIHDNIGNAVTGDTTSIRVVDSSIAANTGAGLSIADGWPMIIDGTTITGNGGSGIATSGQGFLLHTMTITDSTITDNALRRVQMQPVRRRHHHRFDDHRQRAHRLWRPARRGVGGARSSLDGGTVDTHHHELDHLGEPDERSGWRRRRHGVGLCGDRGRRARRSRRSPVVRSPTTRRVATEVGSESTAARCRSTAPRSRATTPAATVAASTTAMRAGRTT